MSNNMFLNLPSDTPFVFDASALINIASSGFCSEFISLLGRKCIAETIVWREVTTYIEKYSLNKNIENAVVCGQIDIVDMSDLEASSYIDFITSPHPNTLDDGEAATIAVAQNQKAIAIIDEKKGNRIAGELVPPLDVLSTLDLFRAIEAECHSRDMCLNTALFNSLTQAKMRVPHKHEGWVVQLLSTDQITQCSSLPLRLRKEVA